MASSALSAWLSPAFSPFTQVSGYLNLLANTIDNFTHGLAVAASFLVSKKVRGGASRALAFLVEMILIATNLINLQNKVSASCFY